MDSLPTPPLFYKPFAENGDKTDLSLTDSNSSNLINGILPKYSLPTSQGGEFAKREDFNALLNICTQLPVYYQNGGRSEYNADIDNSIAGYPANGLLLCNDDSFANQVAFCENVKATVGGLQTQKVFARNQDYSDVNAKNLNLTTGTIKKFAVPKAMTTVYSGVAYWQDYRVSGADEYGIQATSGQIRLTKPGMLSCRTTFAALVVSGRSPGSLSISLNATPLPNSHAGQIGTTPGKKQFSKTFPPISVPGELSYGFYEEQVVSWLIDGPCDVEIALNIKTGFTMSDAELFIDVGEV